MTPAQDATALAEKLVQRHASAYVARGAAISDSIIAECKASREALLAVLRATSQTPDAVLETFLACCERFVEGRPDWRVERVTREKREIISCHGSDRLAAEAAYKIALATPSASADPKAPWRCLNCGDRLTPSASAGPQAGAVQEVCHALNEWADLGCNAVQWFKNIRDGISTTGDALAEMSSNYARIIELSRAAEKNLRANPQPQQADGRGAVIEALGLETQIADCSAALEAIDKNRCTNGGITQWGNERFYQGMKAGAERLLAALQQSDGPAK